MEAPARSGPSIVKPSWWYSKCHLPHATCRGTGSKSICHLLQAATPSKNASSSDFRLTSETPPLSLSVCLPLEQIFGMICGLITFAIPPQSRCNFVLRLLRQS